MSWNLLRTLESILGIAHAEPPTQEAPVVDELSEAIKKLRNVTRRIEEEQKSEAESRIVELQEERLQKAIAAAHSDTRKAIMKCHCELETGVDELTLNELHTFYQEFENKQAAGGPGSLRETIQCSIVNQFHRELGPAAWQRLLKLMEAKGHRWPEPEGISPSATDEERENSRLNNLARDELVFLERPMGRTCDLLVGVVKVWQASYPDRNSNLYREMVYQAVASAIRVQLVEKAVGLTLDVPQELLKKIESVLAEELELVHAALNKRKLSLEEAYHANQITSQAVSKVIPQLVWCHIRKQVLSED